MEGGDELGRDGEKTQAQRKVWEPMKLTALGHVSEVMQSSLYGPKDGAQGTHSNPLP